MPIGPPEGKEWIVVNGWDKDDLFEVDSTTPEQEIEEAKRRFQRLYPSCPIMKVGHVKEVKQ
jgi:hypothetical protein